MLLSMKAAQRNEAEFSGALPVTRRGSSSGSGSWRSSLFGSALFASALARLMQMGLSAALLAKQRLLR